LSEDEFYLAGEYSAKYPKLSVHDSVAMAMAKIRDIILLTGDGITKEIRNYQINNKIQ